MWKCRGIAVENNDWRLCYKLFVMWQAHCQDKCKYIILHIWRHRSILRRCCLVRQDIWRYEDIESRNRLRKQELVNTTMTFLENNTGIIIVVVLGLLITIIGILVCIF